MAIEQLGTNGGGHMLGRRRLAAVVLVTMLALYLPFGVFGLAQEAGGSPALAAMGLDQSTGSMAGKKAIPAILGDASLPGGTDG